MKTKTIRRVISNKLNHWLESIKDENLRKEVKENLLVSGGAIASMLTNEPVNDYDIYIKDVEVLLRLAEYYCKGGIVLDGRKRDALLEDRFPHVDKNGYCENLREKYIAEPYVRISNLKHDQVKLDINGAGEKITHETPEDFENPLYRPTFLSQNAISLENDIQIVLRFHGDSEAIHKTFDFIHATNYFTFEEGLVLNPEALESLLTKNLVYQGSLYPLTSIIRMKKFLGRGYTMNAGEILKIMFQISSLDLTNIETLEEQLIGVDVAYFSTLIEALRGVKKENLTSNYINKIIDKVFNQHDGEDHYSKETNNNNQ